jgi:hypothetical protein
LLALPRRLPGRSAGSSPDGAPAGRSVLGDVVPVAVAVALAMSAVSATGGFFVQSAVAGGMAAAHAGTLLAVGSACGIVGRFVFSWQLGSLSRPLDVVAGLLALGGVGLGGLSVAGPGPLLVLATVLAFGAGWGWNGLLTQTVVAAHPEDTARASAYIMVGAAVGGVVGPTTFGLVAAAAGHSRAWAVAAGALLAAAVVLLSLRVLTPGSGRGGGAPRRGRPAAAEPG